MNDSPSRAPAAAAAVRSYVDACAGGDAARRIEALLERIVARPAVHARFVNTLARLEYVGVRKMLKSRRAERLDLAGLQHALDETVHALRLKKAAVALAEGAPLGGGGGNGDGDAGGVATFADGDTLAGAAGEAYFQALDHAAEAAVRDLPPDHRAEANYLLTSAAVEVRAQAFYPAYERRLRAAAAPFSVGPITRDEDRHLGEMAAALEAALGAWPRFLEPVLAEEETLFGRFVIALEREMASSAGGHERE